MDGEGPRNAVEIPDVAQASDEMRKHWEQIQENMLKSFPNTLPFGNGAMAAPFPMPPALMPLAMMQMSNLASLYSSGLVGGEVPGVEQKTQTENATNNNDKTLSGLNLLASTVGQPTTNNNFPGINNPLVSEKYSGDAKTGKSDSQQAKRSRSLSLTQDQDAEIYLDEATIAGMDEKDIKKLRRKQSNRESARRSRLRKQAECEHLQNENFTLKAEVDRLRKEQIELKTTITVLQSQLLELRKHA
eukprot:jgi/Picre1/29372/NNA_004762.t1